MARILVLYLEDNDDAEVVLETIRTNDYSKLQSTLEFGGIIRPMAMYAYPTNFCDCGPVSQDDIRKGALARGQKYGWWIHRPCGKAVRGHQVSKNLLIPDIHPRDYMLTFSFHAREDAPSHNEGEGSWTALRK